MIQASWFYSDCVANVIMRAGKNPNLDIESLQGSGLWETTFRPVYCDTSFSFVFKPLYLKQLFALGMIRPGPKPWNPMDTSKSQARHAGAQKETQRMIGAPFFCSWNQWHAVAEHSFGSWQAHILASEKHMMCGVGGKLSTWHLQLYTYSKST